MKGGLRALAPFIALAWSAAVPADVPPPTDASTRAESATPSTAPLAPADAARTLRALAPGAKIELALADLDFTGAVLWAPPRDGRLLFAVAATSLAARETPLATHAWLLVADAPGAAPRLQRALDMREPPGKRPLAPFVVALPDEPEDGRHVTAREIVLATGGVPAAPVDSAAPADAAAAPDPTTRFALLHWDRASNAIDARGATVDGANLRLAADVDALRLPGAIERARVDVVAIARSSGRAVVLPATASVRDGETRLECPALGSLPPDQYALHALVDGVPTHARGLRVRR